MNLKFAVHEIIFKLTDNKIYKILADVKFEKSHCSLNGLSGQYLQKLRLSYCMNEITIPNPIRIAAYKEPFHGVFAFVFTLN
jgi:hypothetical protein